MPYVTRAQLETEIPSAHLVAALDDDRDGAEDDGLFDALVTAASQSVDALLSARYDVPFTDPAPSAEAAYAFLGERIYARRELVESNPFKARANFWRERLVAIAQGEVPLTSDTVTASGGGAAITSNAVIDDSMR